MRTEKYLCMAVACTLAATSVAAESDDPLDQIVVTASRNPVSVSQVGASISVITRDDIERREARNIAELLRSVPGFAVAHTGVMGSQTQVRVRGSEANHVLVLIDGMRANDPATGDEFRWEYLSTASIERVEIVRGGQSSLWGSDAIGGVVNIITRSGASGSSLRGYAEGGSFSTTNAGIDGGYSGERWSFDAGVEHLATDGDNISREGTENDDSDLTTLKLNTRFLATDSLTFDFSLRAVDAYSQFDPVDFFVTGLPVDGDVATETTNLFGRFGATLTGERVTHTFRANYFDSENDNLTDGVKNSGTASDRSTFAYQADIGFGDDNLSLALEHEATNFSQRGEVNFGDPNQDQDMDITSLIAEYQGLSLERFSWIVSARYDSNSDFEDALNGRLAASYRLYESTTLRASVGTGRKNPTFTERFGFFPGQFIGNPNLEPERSVSWDIGVDQRFAGGAGLLQITLFSQDLKDEINGFVFDPETFLSTAENQEGTSERDGVEVAATWTINANAQVGMHYTYTDASDENATELRRPRHQGGFLADVNGFDSRFRATLTADFGGERQDIFFPPFPNPSEIVTLDSYWLVDLALQFQVTDGVRLFARGTNLLDEDYEQVFGYQTLGRAGYVGVRIDFSN